MSNQKYTAYDFFDIDPLFHVMSVAAINELDWVEVGTSTLNARRRKLGIPKYRPPKKYGPPLTIREIDGFIRNMGGVTHHG